MGQARTHDIVMDVKNEHLQFSCPFPIMDAIVTRRCGDSNGATCRTRPGVGRYSIAARSGYPGRSNGRGRFRPRSAGPQAETLSMSLTPSTMLPLGSKAPDFRLPDTDGELVALGDSRDAPALLVIFLCNHCPYVKHVSHELAKLG